MDLDDAFKIGFCCVLLFGLYSCMKPECQSGDAACFARVEARKVQTDKDCSIPSLAATAPDGTQLWYLPTKSSTGEWCNRNYPIYFSKSGTQTWHSERHGKTSEDVPDYVPNAEHDKQKP